MPIIQGNCAIGGTGNAALCHADPSVAMPMEAGGTRQYFGAPAPAVNSTTTLAMIWSGFVGASAPSTEDLTMDIVNPGNVTNSFLWYKINGTQGTLDATNACERGDLGDCGSAMPLPLTGSTVTLLPTADIQLFCNWIAQGAKNN
jgi:hypothetical protein